MKDSLEGVDGVEAGHGSVTILVFQPLDIAIGTAGLVAEMDGIIVVGSEAAALVGHPKGDHVAGFDVGREADTTGEIPGFPRGNQPDIGDGAFGIALLFTIACKVKVVRSAAGGTGQFGDFLVRIADEDNLHGALVDDRGGTCVVEGKNNLGALGGATALRITAFHLEAVHPQVVSEGIFDARFQPFFHPFVIESAAVRYITILVYIGRTAPIQVRHVKFLDPGNGIFAVHFIIRGSIVSRLSAAEKVSGLLFPHFLVGSNLGIGPTGTECTHFIVFVAHEGIIIEGNATVVAC